MKNKILATFWFFIFSVGVLKAEPYRLPNVLNATNTELPAKNNTLSTIHKIKVKQFIFKGNIVITDQQLSKICQAYLNQWVSMQQLMQLKQRISQFYIDRGYINSGAILPDQQVIDGKIYFDIIEGKLSSINISNNEHISEAYIFDKLSSFQALNSSFQTNAANKPESSNVLNLVELQTKMKLLEQDPLIEKIDAQLKPGLSLGESSLDIKIQEKRPYQLSLLLNNYRSPSVGAQLGKIVAEHKNLFGHGEAVLFNYGLLDDKNDLSFMLSMPVQTSQTTASIQWDKTSSAVVQEPFNSLGFKSNLERFSFMLKQQLQHSLHQEITIGTQLSLSQSDTRLLGELFAFPPGVAQAQVNEWSFFSQWMNRHPSRVLVARAELGLGLNILNATHRANKQPDGVFKRFRGQFNWLERLSLDQKKNVADVLLRINVQLSDENLLSINQFAMGGAQTVRGYRENSLIRDNGVISSLELHIPVENIFSQLKGRIDNNSLIIKPFIDYGYGWNAHDFLQLPNDLLSMGVALQWQIQKHIRLDFSWAKALKTPQPDYNSNLQDKGFHLQLTVDAF